MMRSLRLIIAALLLVTHSIAYAGFGVGFPCPGPGVLVISGGGDTCTGVAGYNTIGATNAAIGISTLILNKVSSSCSLSSGTFYAYLSQTNDTLAWLTIIAADGASGEPGTILWKSSILPGTSIAWVNLQFSGLSYTGDYYIGVWNSAPNPYISTNYTSNSGVVRYAIVSGFSSLSSVSGVSFSTSTALRSFYVSM